MLTAVEALMLPSAQLTQEERTDVEVLLADIQGFVDKNMKREGINTFATQEVRARIIMEAGRQLKAKKWQVNWQPRVEPNRFDPSKKDLTGYFLLMVPVDEAYQEADNLMPPGQIIATISGIK